MPDSPATRPAGTELAAFLESRRSSVIAAYQQWLQGHGSALLSDPSTGLQLESHANELLTDLITALQTGHGPEDDNLRMLPKNIGESRAAQGMHPVESLRAAAGLYDVIMRTAEECPAVDVRTLGSAARMLSYAMSLRIAEAVASYHGFLLGRLHNAQADERHRIARDLHDRVSVEVSVAARHLELWEVADEGDQFAARRRVRSARQELAKAMTHIRQLTVALRRRKPIEGIEKGLRDFLDGTPVGTPKQCDIIVNGDEGWIPPQTRDEVFLVLREALRNSVKHGRASTVLVRIDIAPHELRASVLDDGAGFDTQALSSDSRQGQGIPSMRERIELLSGTIDLLSLPDHGTKIEVWVPHITSARDPLHLSSRTHHCI